MNLFRRVGTLLLAVLLCASCVSASYYEPVSHTDVPFSEMRYTGIDPEAVDAFCARFENDPIALYPELVALYDEIYTQDQLAYIRMCKNVSDEALAEESERTSGNYTTASDRIYLALSRALDSPHGDELAALMPEGEAEVFANYEPMSEDAFTASDEETALLHQYYQLPDDESFADAAGELYLRLAALRREEAAQAGFDSYPEYAYYVSYAWEFAPEDMAALQRIVKKRLAPLYVRCALAFYDAPPLRGDEDIPADDEIMNAVAAYIGEVSPELNEAMDYLLRNRLYFIASGDELLDTGYTSSLPAYGAAFIFDRAYSRFYAYKDAVHEFGHFNAAYHDPMPMLYQYDNMDVAEIQSQGLELLFLPYLQDILAGEDESQRNVVALSLLSDILYSVVSGCLYDEFEQAVYADPDMTVSGLHKLEQRLLAEYGLSELYDAEPEWPYVTHLFSSPGYYISYATSAVPALDLWLRSLSDRDAAVDAYLSISAARTDAWFFDVLYDNGLCDPTDSGDLARFAGALEQQLGKFLPDAAPAAILPIAGTVIVLGVIVVVLLRRKSSVESESFDDADEETTA